MRPDGEHRENDLAAFLGGVCKEQERGEHRARDFTARGGRARHMRARPLRRPRRPARARASGAAIAALAQLQAGRVERAPAEQRRRRGPGLGLAGPALGARLRAERDELGEVVHRLDAAGRRDPDEPVRVEVVAEQERRVGIGRGEEPRPAVVEQVALVDRLHPEREDRIAELREDGDGLALAGAAAATRPRAGSLPPPPPRASPRRRPQLSKKSPTASIVRSISSSPCASETNMHSNWDGAT